MCEGEHVRGGIGTVMKRRGILAAAGTFSWRVVAKRNDITGDRMPVWNMPTPAPLPGKKP